MRDTIMIEEMSTLKAEVVAHQSVPLGFDTSKMPLL